MGNRLKKFVNGIKQKRKLCIKVLGRPHAVQQTIHNY